MKASLLTHYSRTKKAYCLSWFSGWIEETPAKKKPLWTCTYWPDSDQSVEAAYQMAHNWAKNNKIEGNPAQLFD